MRVRFSAHATFGSPPLFLAVALVLLAVNPARAAVELFAFRDPGGRVLAFAVPNTDVISRS